MKTSWVAAMLGVIALAVPDLPKWAQAIAVIVVVVNMVVYLRLVDLEHKRVERQRATINGVDPCGRRGSTHVPPIAYIHGRTSSTKEDA